MPSTNLLLRVDERETAAFIARQIGDRKALHGEIGMSTGEYANRFSLNPSRRTDGAILVHKANGYDDRRAGWDATFNAPKSVSVQALVGGVKYHLKFPPLHHLKLPPPVIPACWGCARGQRPLATPCESPQ